MLTSGEDHPCCGQVKEFREQLVYLHTEISLRQAEIWRLYGDGQLTPYQVARYLDALIDQIKGREPNHA